MTRCTACGDCVAACPRGLFTILPLEARLIVQCKSLLEGEAARAQCAVACNACGCCAADSPPGLVQMSKGGRLPEVDYGLIELQTPNVVRRCPTGAIAWVEGAQFAAAPPPARPVPPDARARARTPATQAG